MTTPFHETALNEAFAVVDRAISKYGGKSRVVIGFACAVYIGIRLAVAISGRRFINDAMADAHVERGKQK